MKKLAIGFAIGWLAAFALVLAFPLNAQELCTGGPCTANTGTEFSAAAAQNGSKGQVEIDGAVTPNGTGNPTGLRMIWNATGTGTGTPQGVVNYQYGYTGSSATINEYSQNDSAGTNQTFMGGNGLYRGGSFATTAGHNYAAVWQTFGSSTLNATIVALANGSGTAANVGGTFLATNGGGSGLATALYAGSHSAKPTYVKAVAQFNSAAVNPLPPLVLQIADATVFQVRTDGSVQLVDAGLTKPTCDATHRGALWYVAGGAGVADTFEACTKSAADVYAWAPLP